jgi:hypothetical protein
MSVNQSNIDRFNFIAGILAMCTVQTAIAGGAVRDLVTGVRPIKDFDVLVHENNASKLVAELGKLGFKSEDDRTVHIEDLGSNHGDFAERYNRFVLFKIPFTGGEYLTLDLLVLPDSDYDETTIYGVNYFTKIPNEFSEAVQKFDNTMNMWVYSNNRIAWIPNGEFKYGEAVMVTAPDQDRLDHVRRIVEELGWKYVPKDEA